MCVVAAKLEYAATPGCDKEILIAVGIDIVPAYPGAELAQPVWKQRLSYEVVEGCLGVLVPELIRYIRKNW